jgi:hypothetical protein
MDNIYTAFAQGSIVKIYNALTGVQALTRDVGDNIISCVCAGNVLTLTVQVSAATKFIKTYKLPSFELINSIPISN